MVFFFFFGHARAVCLDEVRGVKGSFDGILYAVLLGLAHLARIQ